MIKSNLRNMISSVKNFLKGVEMPTIVFHVLPLFVASIIVIALTIYLDVDAIESRWFPFILFLVTRVIVNWISIILSWIKPIGKYDRQDVMCVSKVLALLLFLVEGIRLKHNYIPFILFAISKSSDHVQIGEYLVKGVIIMLIEVVIEIVFNHMGDIIRCISSKKP